LTRRDSNSSTRRDPRYFDKERSKVFWQKGKVIQSILTRRDPRYFDKERFKIIQEGEIQSISTRRDSKYLMLASTRRDSK
jgi:murein L,D-transpeptidase YcbB/YkuD